VPDEFPASYAEGAQRPESPDPASTALAADLAHDLAIGDSPAVRDFFGPAYDAVFTFGTMLRDQGELRGLIGPREVSRLWERHLLNSAALVAHLPEAGTLVDVGSGAGLPGIVVAAMRPALEVILIEPMERRTIWLTEVVEALGLTNVEIKRGRAEEYHGAFEADVVTARAVANLAKLSRICLPLLRPGGEMVLLKGRNVAQEIDPARKALRSLKATDPEIFEGHTISGIEPTTICRVRLR